MRKKNSFMKYVFILLSLVVFGLGAFVFISPTFEKNSPVIKLEDKEFWNLRDKLSLNISDDSGLKYYRVVFNDGTKDSVIASEVLSFPSTSVNLEITPPKLDMFFKAKSVSIKVEAIDSSKWNFFDGNVAYKEYKLNLDTKKPIANVIRNSLAIRKGGSAVAIVEVRDENLKEAYIKFNDEEKFELIPFYKEGYFISLIAWPVTIENFDRVSLVAIDKADNITQTKIPLYIRELKIKNDDIKISDSFIENVSKSVLNQSNENIPNDLVNTFIYENNTLRSKNVETIKTITRKYMNRDLVDSLDINSFRRLRGSREAAGFAERRHYYHNNEKIDEAWHLGVDWASVKQATIRSTNSGKVIFNDYLGIYGNTIIIDHKMGLSTLYAHTSSTNVKLGDEVRSNQKIANTGSTGAVLGDHLHFGVLVQGIEVNPKEWMDKNWIKSRITDIIEDAKKAINSK